MVIEVSLVMRPMTVKREAKVGYLQMTGGSDEKVVRLDVSMNPFQSMSLFNTKDHFSNVPLRNRLRKNIVSDQQAEKVTTWHVVHYKVEIVQVLKAGNKRNHPSNC